MITYDTSVVGGGNGVNSFNFAALTTNGNYGLLIAAISYSNGSASVTSVISGGINLVSGATRVANAGNSANGYTEFWYAPYNTHISAAVFAVTMGGGAFPQVSGVLSAHPGTANTRGVASIGNISSSSNTTANPSLSVTTTASDSLVIGVFGQANNNTYTAGTSQTINNQTTGGAASRAAIQRQDATTANSGTSVTCSITCAASNWAAFAVELLNETQVVRTFGRTRPRAFAPGITR